MAVEVATTRRRFSREEYHRMAEVGILKPTDKVELIHGEIVTMSPMGRRHRAFVVNLHRLLTLRLSDRAEVHAQVPIVLSGETEPEPDVAVYRIRMSVPFKDREPYAEDAMLLIEVADTSLTYDRTTKLRLYAEAAIPEYWVVDCATESIEIHRSPAAGGYREISRVSGAGTVSPEAFPDVVLTLAEIFA